MIQLKTREVKKSLFREGVLGDIDLPEFIILWTHMFPMDKIYREKHGIPFGSEAHRSIDPIDMITELAQDSAITSAIRKDLKEKDPTAKYFGGRGKYFKTSRSVSNVTQKEIDSAFDNIDVNDIKINDDGTINI